ncbi:MAG: hypothetical protein R3F61_29065 [Myxococcota bacterium]
MRLLPLFVLMACEPMPPTGNPLAPVPAARPAASGPKTGTPAPVPSTEAPKPSGTGSGFDFDEDAGSDDGSTDAEPLDAATLLALSQGKQPPRPAPTAAPVPAPAPEPVSVPVMAAPAMPVWDPAAAVPADWGVRLVSTLVELQPPRAVLGLSDGSEVVVQPGTFLPDQRLVVMAVGRNAVQVSRVIPDGYQARVETHTISSLFPTQPVQVP